HHDRVPSFRAHNTHPLPTLAEDGQRPPATTVYRRPAHSPPRHAHPHRGRLMLALVPLAAFALAVVAGLRSLGWGFVAMFAVGYFNGVIRANSLSIYTTFMFDAAVLGLYTAFLGRAGLGLGSGTGERLALFLIAWPMLLAVVPVNDLLVQLVAL